MALRTARTSTAAVINCIACGELLGRGYPACDGCAERVNRALLPDWRDLLEAEELEQGSVAERTLAETVVSEKPGRRSWMCVDHALSLLPCPDCRGALGSGEQDCPRCAAADAHRWRWVVADPVQGTLRSATLALRASHRTRRAMVTTWRLCLPFALTGQAPTPYQRRKICAAVLASRDTELSEAGSLAELLAFTGLPWRGFTATSPAPVALPAR